MRRDEEAWRFFRGRGRRKCDAMTRIVLDGTSRLRLDAQMGLGQRSLPLWLNLYWLDFFFSPRHVLIAFSIPRVSCLRSCSASPMA